MKIDSTKAEFKWRNKTGKQNKTLKGEGQDIIIISKLIISAFYSLIFTHLSEFSSVRIISCISSSAQAQVVKTVSSGKVISFSPGLQTVEDNKMLILAILVFTSTLAPSLAQNNVAGLQALVLNSSILHLCSSYKSLVLHWM